MVVKQGEDNACKNPLLVRHEHAVDRLQPLVYRHWIPCKVLRRSLLWCVGPVVRICDVPVVLTAAPALTGDLALALTRRGKDGCWTKWDKYFAVGERHYLGPKSRHPSRRLGFDSGQRLPSSHPLQLQFSAPPNPEITDEFRWLNSQPVFRDSKDDAKRLPNLDRSISQLSNASP